MHGALFIVIAAIAVLLFNPLSFLASMFVASEWPFYSRSDGPDTVTLSAIHGLTYWSLAWLGVAVLATGGGLAASWWRAAWARRLVPIRWRLGVALAALVAVAALIGVACGESVETRIDAGAQEVSVRTHFLLLRADQVRVHSTASTRTILFYYYHGNDSDYTRVYLLDRSGRRIAQISTDGASIRFDRELTRAISSSLGLPIRCEEVSLFSKDFHERCDPNSVPTY